MPDKLRWFKFFPADWVTDDKVEEMTYELRGIYIHMLCFQWINGSLPAQPSKLAKLLGLTEAQVAQILPKLSHCFKKRRGKLYNSKLNSIREVSVRTSALRAKAGSKGGKASTRKGISNKTTFSPAYRQSKPGSSIQEVEVEVEGEGEGEQDKKKVSNDTFSTDPAGPGSAVEGTFLGVPDCLIGLELYQADEKLCKRLPELLPAWERAYPGVDVGQEIAAAHAWEVSNPSKRKKDRPRFLANWLKRQQDRPRPTSKNNGGYRDYNAERKARQVETDRDIRKALGLEKEGLQDGQV